MFDAVIDLLPNVLGITISSKLEHSTRLPLAIQIETDDEQTDFGRVQLDNIDGTIIGLKKGVS